MRFSPPPSLSSPQNVILEDGRIEHRVQVDRRRLEAMITGDSLPGTSITLPPAESFFQQVQSLSGAEVCWPSKLKIGAKTKKDPFVKILASSLDQIEQARELILATLQVRRDRVTMKIEIHHLSHSHIIGKGGSGVQRIMRATGCHVHFPDSNKFSEPHTKSDQVSISGSAVSVEHARRQLRDMCPVVVSFDFPHYYPHPLQPPPAIGGVAIMIRQLSDHMWCCTVRGTSGEEAALSDSVARLAAAFQCPHPIIRTTVDIRASLVPFFQQSTVTQRLSSVCLSHSVVLHPPTPDRPAVGLIGTLPAVLAARRSVIGVLPLSLHLDVPLALASRLDVHRLSTDHAIGVHVKQRTAEQATVVLKCLEEQVCVALVVRELICSPSSLPPFHPLPLPPSAAAAVAHTTAQMAAQSCRSPDPDDSPIAHSLLASAKHIDKPWPPPTRPSREEMLQKANQAIFEPSPPRARYPTDQWAGYGFSCSLPADLLKGMLDLSTDAPTQTVLSPPRREVQRENGFQHSFVGLCSVREEEEYEDCSLASYSTSGGAGSGGGYIPTFNAAPRRNAFSASTSIFDSSPSISDLEWDISRYSDPAMVLAQLACSEYTPNLRDQEIDMHAFLLLNEQNLKDIGISTIGARKKIHHAIIKLRESARLQGYAL